MPASDDKDRTLKITAYQGTPSAADKAANLGLVERVCRAATLLGSDVTVFPELFVTGYNLGERLLTLAEPLDGDSLDELARIARTHRQAIVIGLPERDGDSLYNTAVAIDAEGRLLARHRKVFLFGEVEKRLFRPGDSFDTFELCGQRCGLSICYDLEFPESAREVAWRGARVLFNPTANMSPYHEVPATLARARALENGLVVVYANLCGHEGDQEYTGLSAIIAPDGTDLARAGRDTCLLLADTAPSQRRWEVHPWSTQLADLQAWRDSH
ncbi:carbon-nitrogen hydrolase [Stutzerimonas kirkiae]|uniref:Carbon-nitrogen hydrolase n=1 Tax=Stutzerimonas kirkiae TaxID=2211392 RepID=A0A4Q9RCR2_9GAMM|nr:carbon-nitrogen hydrolase [Stutzerimonas kirkiae]TBV01554.1 carbon-nitrogen hydrolase [Stutzerimonas kirkiae]TBV10342.1 carbon-nitrogen hydrolase [Stutzerimonas kirkiae]